MQQCRGTVEAMGQDWVRVDYMEPAEAVRLLLAGVPEYQAMYGEEAPVATGQDREPLLHVVFGNLALFYEREVAGRHYLERRFWHTIEQLASSGGRYVADDALAGSFIEHFCLGDEAQQRLIEEAAEFQGPATRKYVEFYSRGLQAEPARLARRLEKARRRATE
jgi:hypothetical protein